MEINLLPSDDLENRPGGKFLKWALSWGKKIVVLTELVVILAFLSRFWLDTRIADQIELINQKKSIVMASADFEKEFRLFTQRLTQAREIEDTPSILTVYDLGRSLISSDLDIKQISIVNNKLFSLSGSGEESSVGKTIEAFKNSQKFTNISVERVAKQGYVNQVEFSLTANF